MAAGIAAEFAALCLGLLGVASACSCPAGTAPASISPVTAGSHAAKTQTAVTKMTAHAKSCRP